MGSDVMERELVFVKQSDKELPRDAKEIGGRLCGERLILVHQKYGLLLLNCLNNRHEEVVEGPGQLDDISGVREKHGANVAEKYAVKAGLLLRSDVGRTDSVLVDCARTLIMTSKRYNCNQ